MREEIIFIPLLLPTANLWITFHFGKKKEIKQRNHLYIKQIIKAQMEQGKMEQFSGKVIIEFQPYVGKTSKKAKNSKSTRPFDKINYWPSIKYFEDCIVNAGLLVDDSNDYVLKHIINEVIVDRNIYDDGMIMLIKEVPDDYSAERMSFFYEKVLNQLERVKKKASKRKGLKERIFGLHTEN